jgi:hypothetical protein
MAWLVVDWQLPLVEREEERNCCRFSDKIMEILGLDYFSQDNTDPQKGEKNLMAKLAIIML